MNIIESQQISKTYGKMNALSDVCLTINSNTITGFIGRNGAGKTTLLKIIAGYLQPSSGEVRVFGEKPFNSLKVSANTIFIDDQMHIPQLLTLEEVLLTAETFYANWDMELAKRLFAYFNFHPKQRHNQLSKGKKSTFNMILGLASRCALTIFDEPTTGMDASVRKDFYRALLKDYMNHPRTIILSSHLLNEIDDLLEDVLLIRSGHKRLHLPIEDLKQYALGIRGNKEIVEPLIANNEVLYKETLGSNSVYVVIKNHWTQEQMQRARLSGVDVSGVAPDDICIYLTNETKGGIDDVFEQR